MKDSIELAPGITFVPCYVPHAPTEQGYFEQFSGESEPSGFFIFDARYSHETIQRMIKGFGRGDWIMIDDPILRIT